MTAIEVGWPVMDHSGAFVGTVSELEGEPALGRVTGLVVSLGTQHADRRVRIDQLQAVERGVVRLAGGKADLELA
jgi:sporulation protein YlmC with PRC-barrel domain